MTAVPSPSTEAGARRALVLHDRRLVVDLIELTLNRGLFVVSAATSLAEAEDILGGALVVDAVDRVHPIGLLGCPVARRPDRHPLPDGEADQRDGDQDGRRASAKRGA